VLDRRRASRALDILLGVDDRPDVDVVSPPEVLRRWPRDRDRGWLHAMSVKYTRSAMATAAPKGRAWAQPICEQVEAVQ
jgi:hypothetical protein